MARPLGLVRVEGRLRKKLDRGQKGEGIEEGVGGRIDPGPPDGVSSARWNEEQSQKEKRKL